MALNFVKAFFNKREGVRKYREELTALISDRVLSEQEQKKLNQIVISYKLEDKDLFESKKNAFVSAYNKIINDERITTDEIILLENLLSYLHIKIEQTGVNLNLFRKYANLATIETGVLPDVTDADTSLNIIFKDGERLHYRVSSLLRKVRRVTKSVQYGGLTASIKITKGLRYRMGSLNVGRTTSEILAVEDNGIFYITSQRIGYHGQRKQFSVPYNKVSSLELRSDGLYLFKEGKEQPYIITLDDYDVALAITSFIINKDEKSTEIEAMGFNFKTPAIEKYIKETSDN